ncbi:hypothetical protein EQJ94_16375 [Escherichia coli]|nr:hypothetical protein [Escherichia coli]EFO0417163.1 hypothetical protein [Escherichia coli]
MVLSGVFWCFLVWCVQDTDVKKVRWYEPCIWIKKCPSGDGPEHSSCSNRIIFIMVATRMSRQPIKPSWLTVRVRMEQVTTHSANDVYK